MAAPALFRQGGKSDGRWFRLCGAWWQR